jgi:hypothetical protein
MDGWMVVAGGEGAYKEGRTGGEERPFVKARCRGPPANHTVRASHFFSTVDEDTLPSCSALLGALFNPP